MSERNESPRELPVLDAGVEAARLERREGEDLATAAERVVAGSPLLEQVDAAMGGHASPRIWLLLHEPGAGADAAVAALAFARALAERDQAALVLDCDERDLPLTRWSGREGADGWVDLVRYGASVLTCGESLPFPGRTAYLLGLGSYAPADVTAQEVEALIARLRRQADDLILICPADELGQLWAPSADIRLLCGGRDAALAAERAAAFARAGSPLTGRVAFGPAPSRQPAPPPVETPAETAPEPPAAVPEDDVEAAVGRLDEVPAAAAEPAAVPGPGHEFARRRGSSGVFRFVAVSALVVIALAVGYYLQFVREPAAPMAVVTPPPPTAPEPEATDAVPTATAVPQDEAAAGLDVAVVDSAAAGVTPPAAAVDSVAAPPTEGAAQVSAPVVEPPADAAPDSFFMDYYLVPVGGDGWALHVYSFPDSVGVDEQIRLLEARGFQTARRTVQIKDKGRWFRVYLGSFRSRSEALSARDPLLRELGQDWANPVRF